MQNSVDFSEQRKATSSLMKLDAYPYASSNQQGWFYPLPPWNIQQKM